MRRYLDLDFVLVEKVAVYSYSYTPGVDTNSDSLVPCVNNHNSLQSIYSIVQGADITNSLFLAARGSCSIVFLALTGA